MNPLRRLNDRCRTDPWFLAHRLARHQQRHRLTEAELCRQLGCGVDTLLAAGLCREAGCTRSPAPDVQLCERHREAARLRSLRWVRRKRGQKPPG